MTKNKKQVTVQIRASRKQKNKNGPSQPRQVQKYTPFRDVGGTVGSMFGPIGKTVGKWLGTGIGTIFGSGDYRIQDDSDYNVLTTPNQIPQFASSRQAVVISHREFVGDVTGSVNFKSTAYSINPGNSDLFPWLAATAQNFDHYKLHGLIFEFKSTSSDTNNVSPALGTVIMATSYDPYDAPFPNKMMMENSEYAVSTKPSQSMLHGVECASKQTPLNEMYVQTNVPAGQDARFNNLGVFYIATSGMTSPYIVGELWVSYVVELIKPRMASTVGGGITGVKFKGSLCNGAYPLGQPTVNSAANFSFGTGSNAVYATGFTTAVTVGNTYYFTCTWVQPVSSSTPVAPDFTFTGGQAVQCWSDGGYHNMRTVAKAGSGVASAQFVTSSYYLIATSTSLVITCGGGTFVVNTMVDVLLTEVDSGLNLLQ